MEALVPEGIAQARLPANLNRSLAVTKNGQELSHIAVACSLRYIERLRPMLHPHSLLWHYLWVGPYFLLAALAALMRKRGLHKEFPAFFFYTIFEAVGGTIVYILDITPVFSSATYWRGSFIFLVIEVLVKFAVVGEVFTHLLRRYRPLSKLASLLISGVGVVLILTGTIVAAYANSTNFWIISATRILGRSVSIAQCGLIIFLFIFATHFHLRWDHAVFGITLGFGIIASFSLAYWALTASWILGPKTYLLDFLVMATYHLCVLIWCYYLLVPHKETTTSTVALPENNLAIWNRELERLLQ
jgi:hypothetical protein